MHTAGKFAFAVIALATFTAPAVSSAATLTPQQMSAIIALLQAFGVDQAIVAQIEQTFGGTPVDPPAPPQPAVPHVPATGSPYTASNVGYDMSYNAFSYPATNFNFGIVGVTGGKAFVNNSRIVSEYSWARFGSATAPTIYMNLNAPYGSTVAGHSGSPKSCPPRAATSATATGTEPTACEGYNYGYNAAQDAFAYAKNHGVESALWWLDIEEANSWSDTLAVNDATIQGAIDYLNVQNVRAGIYSARYMWNSIAGADFVPTQTINGQAVPVPTWLPIGITTLVGAINSCANKTSFITGSPVWLVQYVANSTAVDQNVAC